MLTTVSSLKKKLSIVDTLVNIDIVANVVGSEYNLTFTGDGILTISELVGVNFTVNSGGTTILGYQQTFSTTGGDAVTQSTFVGQIGNATEDEYLLEEINIISGAVENYCNRKFNVSDYVQTFYLNGHSQNHHPTLSLYHYPLNSITSIEKVLSDGTLELIPSSEYRFHSDTGIITRDVTGDLFTDWFVDNSKLMVSYNAGFTTIPAPLKGAVDSLIIERYNKNKVGAGANFGSDVQQISIPGVMSISFDYTLENNTRSASFGIYLGNYRNVFDFYRSERSLVHSGVLSYVS